MLQPQPQEVNLNLLEAVLRGGRGGEEDGLHRLQPLHSEGQVPGEPWPDPVLLLPTQQGQIQHLAGGGQGVRQGESPYHSSIIEYRTLST